MKNGKNYSITVNFDEIMGKIIDSIKFKINNKIYTFTNLDSYIGTAILVLQKMLENDITPSMFETFITMHSHPEIIKVNFDA